MELENRTMDVAHINDNIIYSVGVCSEIGNYRSTMEDTHFIDKLSSTYGVFDGHGGQKLSSYLKKISPEKFVDLNFEENSTAKIFEEINESAKKELGIVRDGSTLVLVKICKKESLIKCAWVGDSEAWIISDNNSYDNLTPELHNGYNQKEKQRVKDAGGYISFHRLSGMLAVTRAFGNYFFGLVGLTVKPQLSTITIRPDHKFLILACDGIREQYNGISKKDTEISEIVSFIMEKYRNGITDVNHLAKELVSKAFEWGSRDNATAIVIDLRPGDMSLPMDNAPPFLTSLPLTIVRENCTN